MYEVKAPGCSAFFYSKKMAERASYGIYEIVHHEYEPGESGFFELMRYRNNIFVCSEGFFDTLLEAREWAEKNIIDAEFSWEKIEPDGGDFIYVAHRLVI